MPFVRIDAYRTDSDRLDALGRAVHDALVETLAVPPEDHFQVLTGHDGTHSGLRWGDYLGIRRDEGIVFVAITMRAGRTPGRKQGPLPADRRTGPRLRGHRAAERVRHGDREHLGRLVAGRGGGAVPLLARGGRQLSSSSVSQPLAGARPAA
ncbi:tautomerase family protein [Streptomyces albus]|nr:tautomerase family protein [Streptomyces albus]MDI6409833.1 tautomerase family protein [Streptomyces albus]